MPLDRGALRNAFIADYRDVYGYAPVDSVEVVQLRVHARGRSSHMIDFKLMQAAQCGRDTRTPSLRQVYFNRTWNEVPVVSRSSVIGTFDGPAIIESADTTIVVPPGASIEPNLAGGLVVNLKGWRT